MSDTSVGYICWTAMAIVVFLAVFTDVFDKDEK